MNRNKVSKAMLRRLPAYLRYLHSLPEDAAAHISARAMANALGLGEVSVRKDLAVVSDNGRCKVGHHRDTLIMDIENFLGYHDANNAVIVGAGRLGQALLHYEGFVTYGMNILAGFDTDPEKMNTEGDKPVYAMPMLELFCKCYDVSVGIITVPADQAQQACDALVACGIDAIWNFAPVHLTVPENVLVQNENLTVSLTALRMQMNARNNTK